MTDHESPQIHGLRLASDILLLALKLRILKVDVAGAFSLLAYSNRPIIEWLYDVLGVALDDGASAERTERRTAAEAIADGERTIQRGGDPAKVGRPYTK